MLAILWLCSLPATEQGHAALGQRSPWSASVCAFSFSHLCRDIKPEHLYFDKDLKLKLGHFFQAANLALYPIPPQKAALLDYTAPEVTALPLWCCWDIVKHAASLALPCCLASGPLQVVEGWPRQGARGGSATSIAQP